MHLANTGNLTFNDNAGITLSGAAVFNWESAANIVTTGTGMFQNNGGFLVKSALSGNAKVTSDLPYVNNDAHAYLTVQQGTLSFDKAGATNGVSVLQNSGTITIGVDNVRGATLEVDNGLTMNGGVLTTATGFTSNIATGDVKVHGGTVTIGDGGIAELDCDGFVTMDGGTYQVAVDANKITEDLWISTKGFLIGNTATLTVNTIAYPVGGKVPPGKLWVIMATGAKNNITGDFGTKNVNFNDGSGKKYQAAPDPTNQYYDLRS